MALRNVSQRVTVMVRKNGRSWENLRISLLARAESEKAREGGKGGSIG
jgi:hypothetical protein